MFRITPVNVITVIFGSNAGGISRVRPTPANLGTGQAQLAIQALSVFASWHPRWLIRDRDRPRVYL